MWRVPPRPVLVVLGASALGVACANDFDALFTGDAGGAAAAADDASSPAATPGGDASKPGKDAACSPSAGCGIDMDCRDDGCTSVCGECCTCTEAMCPAGATKCDFDCKSGS